MARDNKYWLGRFTKDGHHKLLERIEAGEISVYKARQEAGYLKTVPSRPSDKLTYHWERASHAERKRFIMQHLLDVNRTLKEVGAEIRELKTKKAK